MAEEKTDTAEDDVLVKAKERFEYALSRESENRQKMKEDIRFAAASPDDPWQWDESTRNERKTSKRLMLTVNKLPQHIRQVTNDIRQNRPSIKYRPADDKADPEVADILMGLARHIEAHSDADVAYDTASDHEVTHGLGFIRVIADYVSDDSFDQDIFIKRVKDWSKVHMDPDIMDPAGSDAKWCFIDEELSEDEFKAQYPDEAVIEWGPMTSDSNWFPGDKKVRIAEYFEIVEKPATLCMWRDGSVSFKGERPKTVYAAEKPLKERKTTKRECIWRKMNGVKVLEEKPFPSKYIPVARVVGNEWEVDGKTYISGLVRNSKDSQRMYNIAQTAIAERVMLAPKAPYLIAAEAVEGYEKTWQTANTEPHGFLPWNHKDEADQPLPKPERIQPATVEPGLNQVALTASDDIKAETGQYDASLGQKSNETSGRAIMARQREGDNATYHYVDNLGRGVRHIGRIILDMIPAVYDTKRIARILGEDGEAANAVLDPEQPTALEKVRGDDGAIQRIFNPNIGLYDVYTTTGPSFTTRRVEAVEAMTAMTQANPELWQVIGDLLVKNMDWPGAEDMAERLRLTLIPPVQEHINKDEATPEIPPEVKQRMMEVAQHVEQQNMQLQEMGQALQEAQQKAAVAEAKAQKAEIEAKRAAGLLDVSEAEKEALETVRRAQAEGQPQAAAPAPAAQSQQPLIMPDVNGQLAQVMQPLAEMVAASVQNTEQALQTVSEVGAFLHQASDQTAEQLAALMAEVARPRVSKIEITSPSGATYTGVREEV